MTRTMTRREKVALGTAAAVLLAGALYLASGDGEEEEQPPIIVENGSVVIHSEYAAESDGSRGEWQMIGPGRWRYFHINKGPVRTRNSIFNGACTGTAWNAGPLSITFGPSSSDGEDLVVSLSLQGGLLIVDPGEASAAVDQNDPSRLVVDLAQPDGTAPIASRIKRVAPPGPNPTSYCDFAEGSQPVIRVELKNRN